MIIARLLPVDRRPDHKAYGVRTRRKLVARGSRCQLNRGEHRHNFMFYTLVNSNCRHALVALICRVPVQSLYCHVPFCASKCSYCAFFSHSPDGETVNRFVAGLVRELELVADDLTPQTIFFGGGTPSILNLRHWETLLEAMRRLGPQTPHGFQKRFPMTQIQNRRRPTTEEDSLRR